MRQVGLHRGPTPQVPVKLSVKNSNRNTIVTTNADIADTSQKRRTGLLNHTNLAAGEGLWIVPCEAVHTFGMKFPIDVLYLSKQKKVLKIRNNLKKSRMSLCLRAHSVLELPAGHAELTGTVVGDQLEFTKHTVDG
jgi:uncharacterized membrane protein (UPF0127 family)